MKAELIDHMGSDLSVVNAARVSFDKQSEWDRICVTYQEYEEGDYSEWTVKEEFWDPYYGKDLIKLKPEDAKLISYLAKHDHWTPFAHTSISLRMSAPVPIRTQCFKHKQGLVENEESRRYISSTPKVFYPTWRMAAPSVKQGSAGEFDQEMQERIWFEYDHAVNLALEVYESMIETGVCPEQARFVLPQGCEVNWIWTGNLYAFANFYLKRTDPHAQREIQDLARMVGDIIEPLFPVSWKALTCASSLLSQDRS